MEVSHLFFKDDTDIFCQPDKEMVLNLCGILMYFQAVSGLYINLEKLEMVSMGNVCELDFFAGLVGYRKTSLPLKYLGVALGVRVKDGALWDPVIEMYDKILIKWKRNLLSGGINLFL